MEHVIAIRLGLVIGVPLAALVYWSTRRSRKLGYDGGTYSGDSTLISGGGDAGGGGPDWSA